MTSLTLVLRLSAIGDCVIACRSVKRLVDANCDPVFVTSPMCLEVAASVPHLNRIITVDAKNEMTFYTRATEGVGGKCFSAQPASAIFQNRLEASVIDLHCTSRSRRAAQLLKSHLPSKVQNYLVAKRTFMRWFLVFLSFFTWSQKKRREEFRIKDVVRITDLQDRVVKRYFEKNKLMWKHESKNYFAVTTPLKRNTEYVLFAPGASGLLKMWPKELWRDLAKKILKDTRCDIVLCGGKEDAFLGEYLLFDDPKRIVNLIGKTPLSETFAAVAGAKFVVSCDSFVSHVAAALGRRGAVIFGATSPSFGFLPDSEKMELHYANLKCSPCTRHGGGECRFRNLKCLRMVEPEDVFLSFIREY